MRLPDIRPENYREIYGYYTQEGDNRARLARSLSITAAKLLSPTVTFMPDAYEEIDELYDAGRTAIIGTNHQCAVDPFVLTAAMHQAAHPALHDPVGAAKASLFRGPAGLIFRNVNTIPVFRPQDVPNLSEEEFWAMSDEMLNTFAEFIKRGRPVGIMPEGTRRPEGFLKENLKSGIARVALATSGQSYIVPMAIVYRGNVPRGVGDMADARRARVIIGNPISGYTRDKDTTEQVLGSVFEGVSAAISYGNTGRV